MTKEVEKYKALYYREKYIAEKSNSFKEEYEAILEANIKLTKETKDLEFLRAGNDKYKYLLERLSSFLTPAQILVLERDAQKNKWQDLDYGNAFEIHDSSPKTYRLLYKKGFPIPAVSSLRKWVAIKSKEMKGGEISIKIKHEEDEYEDVQLKKEAQELAKILKLQINKVKDSKYDHLLERLRGFLTPTQVYALERNPQRIKWKDLDYATAFKIHNYSTKVYRLFLEKRFPLPPESSLRKWVRITRYKEKMAEIDGDEDDDDVESDESEDEDISEKIKLEDEEDDEYIYNNIEIEEVEPEEDEYIGNNIELEEVEMDADEYIGKKIKLEIEEIEIV